MTSSHTLLIEPNRLFRQGLKHLLAGTRFEVGTEFNTVELALAAGESAGTPGRFKRSSQHPDKGGCDEEAEAAFGSIWAGSSAVTWPAPRGAT